MGSDVGLLIRRSVSPGGRADQILDWFYLNLWHLDSSELFSSHAGVALHVADAPGLLPRSQPPRRPPGWILPIVLG